MADDLPAVSPAVSDARVPVPLRQEVAGVRRDITLPAFGPYLLNRDPTLLTRGGARGLAIYEDIERDPRTFSVLQKRKMAPLAYPWSIEAASEEPQDVAAAELVTRALEGFSFDKLIYDMGDAIPKGFAALEIMWTVRANLAGVLEVVPAEVRPRDQRRFRFDLDGNLRLLTWSNMLEGEPVPDRKFIVHSVGSKDGSPYGLGLGTRLFWPCFFKREITTFLLTFLDKFAQPTAVAKYPAGTPQDIQDDLMTAVRNIATDAAVVIPDNVLLELLEAQRSSSVDAYERALRYFDEQIAEIVLGETLTTNIGDVGSKAAAGVHNDVRLELTQGDAQLAGATLERSLIAWIVQLNLPSARVPTLQRDVSVGEDLKERSDRDVNIYALGFQPTQDYIDRVYGEGWEPRDMTPPPALVPGADPAQKPGDQASPAFAEPLVAYATDRFADRLGAALAPTVSSWVEEVRKVLAASGSLAEARDRLLEAYPKISPMQFSEVMGKAVLASDLAGRDAIAGHEGRT